MNNNDSTLKNRLSILIIENNSQSVKTLIKGLSVKYNVSNVVSSENGLELLKDNEVDCILLDLHITKKNSIEILKDIRRIYPKIPILMMTNDKEDEEIFLDALKYGAVGRIYKNADIDDFCLEIDRAIETAKSTGLKNMPAEILLVDDEPELLESFKDFFDQMPYSYVIRTSSCGENALEIMKKHKIDILITDIRMPGMSGLELIDKAKKIQSDFQSIVITAHGEYGIAIEALKKGVINYLQKPVKLKELTIAIEYGLSQLSLAKQLKITNRELEFRKKILEKANIEIEKQKLYIDNIIDSMINALIVTGSKGIIRKVNPAALGLLEYSLQELIGQSISIIFDTKECIFKGIDIDFDNKKDFISNVEVSCISKNGKIIPVLFSGSLLLDDSDNITGIVYIAQDITKRKIAEEKVSMLNSIMHISLESRSFKEQLEKILKLIIAIPWLALQSRGCIFITKDDSTDMAIEASYGFSEIQLNLCSQISLNQCLCGKSAYLKEIIFADHIDNRHDIGYQSMTPHGHYCVPIISNDKILGVINLYVNEFHKSEKVEIDFLSSIANTIAGIIERKRMTSQARQMEIKMVAVSELATLGEVAAGIAHEINQPLAYICSFIQSFEKDFDKRIVDLPWVRDRLGKAYGQAKRIDKIIRHLRTFGRKDKGEILMTPLKISDVLNDTLLIMSERIRLRNINLIINIDEDLPIIHGNSNQMEQVFINLFQNAIDALENVNKESKIYINISLSYNKKYIVIRFKDNGTGIDQHKINRIFEPFFTTKEVGKGTGLGLSIVYGIINDHKGVITCKSKINKGTTFTIELPL
jgi:PAS domain S-box-containing protein